MFQLLF
jgi:hypothetical protein